MLPDYSGQNLRGRSFKGQNLEGANFSYADIRSADFTNAKLRGANFSHAHAGLSSSWAVRMIIVALFLSLLLGFVSSMAGIIAIVGLNTKVPNGSFFNAITLIIVINLFSFNRRRELWYQLVSWGVNVVGVLLLGGPGAVAGAVAVGGAIALILVGAGARAVSDSIGVSVSVVGAAAGAITGALSGAGGEAGILTGTMVYLGSNYGQEALAGKEEFALIRKVAVAFAATGGTCFRNADLTDADFTQAMLRSTNFIGANLTRTCWFHARRLEYARVGTTYLEKPQVRHLVITKEAQDKNFDTFILRGLNLHGANLVDASFIGADFSEVNLQDANLSRAMLVQTQLDNTDLTGATLTGAIIEDWNITSHTKLHGVRCEYIYMRLPTKDNLDPLRKPDNNKEVFADGEFEDFIQPIFDTLDLYHNQGVDPRAIAVAFKELAENNPVAELEIVAIEKRGEDKILLRAKTAETANKSELSKEYFLNYNQLKALAEQELQALIAGRDIQIRRLENMITTALEHPSFYAEHYYNQGDTIMPEGSKQQFNNDLRNAQFVGGLVNANTVNAQQIGGNINNYTPQQRQNLAQAAAEIQQLLQQLEQTNPTTTTSEKMTVVAKAIDEIEKNATLKARVIGALKSGGKEALKEAIDHPLVNILMASIEGWQEAE